MQLSLCRDRRAFIGGSDPRIIMGDDQAALLRLWREKRGEAVRARLKPASITIDYFPRFAFTGARSRTPGPPPFWSMNTTPATSSAFRKAASFAGVTGISPSMTSTLRIVATPTFEWVARSIALHRSKARAARICALESFLDISIDLFYTM